METRERETQAPAAPRNGKGSEAQDVQMETTESGRNMRPVMLVIGAIVLIAAIIWGVKYFTYARAHQTTDDARVDATTVAVTSKINERIDRILVDTNQPVKKGQLLVVLDNATEQAAVDQAKANLQLALENQSAGVTQGSGGVAQAQAQAVNAQAQVPAAQAGVAAAQAQVQQAQAALPAAQQQLAQAKANLDRTQALVKSGDMPRAQLDAAKAQYAQADLNVAQQKVGAAQAGVAAAQGGVESAQGKLSQAQAPAQIAAQRAALAIAEQNLKNTKIYAPIDGYVGEKSVEAGQTVNGGMTLLTLIPNDVFITANYKETQVGGMHPGQPVDIKVDAYKGVTFHGKVDSINPASQSTYALVPAQNATGNFVKVTQRIPVKIVFDRDTDFTKYPMRPGMSVVASVQVR